MYSKSILVVSGALLSAVVAVPLNQRDIVWVTEVKEAIVTIPVTETVWVQPGAATPAASSHYGHHNHQGSSSVVAAAVSSSVAPAAYSPSSSSSSVYVAPTTSSSSVYVAPTTSEIPSSTYVAPTTYAAPATTSSAAAAATTSSSSSSGSGLSYGVAAAGTSFTGDLTWYDTGMGACGWTSGSDEAIVAISEDIFDSYPDNGNPNANPLCGQTVTITGVDGSAYTAKIVDRCTGCAQADLDLSQGFFNTVTNNGDGRVHNMKWVMN